MRKVLFMKGSLACTLTLALLCAGCSTACVSTLDSILAAAAPALINILQIVAVAEGQPLNGNLVAKISADTTLIKTLAGDFAKASSGSAPGVCQQLQAAVSAYQADQQLVLQVAQVSDTATQTKIAMLADLVAGTVSAITAAIPSCNNAAAFRTMNAVPAYNASTFVADYNRILGAATGNAVVDAETRKLRLHLHSKIVRLAPFGMLR